MRTRRPSTAATPAHIAAEELAEGQWFWHEPVPGTARRWALQVAAMQLGENTIRIVTTDDLREVVSYPRDRRVRLAPNPLG